MVAMRAGGILERQVIWDVADVVTDVVFRLREIPRISQRDFGDNRGRQNSLRTPKFNRKHTKNRSLYDFIAPQICITKTSSIIYVDLNWLRKQTLLGIFYSKL
jgi:hypothetical protein